MCGGVLPNRNRDIGAPCVRALALAWRGACAWDVAARGAWDGSREGCGQPRVRGMWLPAE